MKGFIELHRYTDGYYDDTDPILVNASKINTVYRLKRRISTFSYDNITTISIDNTEYCVKESYDTVLNMIEEATSDSVQETDTDDLEGEER